MADCFRIYAGEKRLYKYAFIVKLTVMLRITPSVSPEGISFGHARKMRTFGFLSMFKPLAVPWTSPTVSFE
jgi:hypothetical protein